MPNEGGIMNETIDPTGRTEHTSAGGHDRRNFFRLAGLGGAAVALAACGVDPTRATAVAGSAAASTAAATGGGSVTYDFGLTNDGGILNFAYAMEQLGEAFYANATSNAQFATIFSAGEQRILRDFLGHETAHRDLFKAALGAAGIVVTPNFSSVNFADRTSVLTTARTFENTCVAALNGAGPLLHVAANLALAGKLVSVEARQASALNDLLSPKSGAFAPSDFDMGDTPQQVVAIVQPFVVEKINVINVTT
ncbi:hypothetical protein tb265_05110 [Gemmatimonadetes bacterium T265]|nr:hypothetical protein tb265_05110 [Gemmatimonadetes bacterium T265]